MTKRLLIVDNYDSFTYNLVQLVEKCGVSDYSIQKNDNLNFAEAADFDSFLLSPGPGIPAEAGLLCDLIANFAPTKKILGVCLGHQAIAECFGAKLIQMNDIMHGIGTETNILPNENNDIFKNIPNNFVAGRYHSWIVSRVEFPESLIITATDKENQIMALRHKHFNVVGVQFHPESYITKFGFDIIRNWISL